MEPSAAPKPPTNSGSKALLSLAAVLALGLSALAGVAFLSSSDLKPEQSAARSGVVESWRKVDGARRSTGHDPATLYLKLRGDPIEYRIEPYVVSSAREVLHAPDQEPPGSPVTVAVAADELGRGTTVLSVYSLASPRATYLSFEEGVSGNRANDRAALYICIGTALAGAALIKAIRRAGLS